MKRFGLIGHPVAGSFSPKLFEAAYGGRYPYDLIEGAEFGASWQRFLDEYDGINITAPFKQDAFHTVDVLSDDAWLCGAVNLAVKTPDGILGYNTDVDGVVLAVRETGLPVSDALVVGCGGDWIPTDDLPALSPDLVIYTVPGPMDGLPDFTGAVILEANYRTPVLAGRGRAYISGLRWLLYQAVAGYGIFTGETPDADAMFRIFC